MSIALQHSFLYGRFLNDQSHSEIERVSAEENFIFFNFLILDLIVCHDDIIPVYDKRLTAPAIYNEERK